MSILLARMSSLTRWFPLALLAMGCSTTSASELGGAPDAKADRSGGDRDSGPSTKGDAGLARDADASIHDGGASDRDPLGDAERTTHDAGHDTSRPDAADDAKDDVRTEDGADAHHDGHAEASVDAGPAALRIIGRVLTDGSAAGSGTCTAATPCFEWSGTQVVARVAGATAVSFVLGDDGNYFDVYVDGVLQAGPPIIGSGGVAAYPAATGLDATKTHEVRLYKRTEASSDGVTFLGGVAFPNGGTLLPPSPAARHRIEVVGDSISCGYGVLGLNASCIGAVSNEDHDDSYGALTARSLDADLYTIASSGLGMYEDLNGNTANTVPSIYGLTLPYVTGVPATWSFASWTPDAVVIDLGTNDFVGSSGDPGAGFVTAYEAFLARVRQNYPAAYIVCTNGPMLAGAEYALAATYIQQAIAAVNDAKVMFLAFPTQNQSPTEEGCDGHPNPATHQAMAAQLTALLQPLLP